MSPDCAAFSFVLAAVPQRVLALVVAGRARRVDLVWLQFLEVGDFVVHRIRRVLAAGPVTRLAALPRRRCPGIHGPVMFAFDVLLFLCVVTGETGVFTDIFRSR